MTYSSTHHRDRIADFSSRDDLICRVCMSLGARLWSFVSSIFFFLKKVTLIGISARSGRVLVAWGAGKMDSSGCNRTELAFDVL